MYGSSLKWDKFYEKLNDEDKRELQNSSSKSTYSAKEIIFRENRQPFGIYIIINGSVKLYNTNENNRKHIFQICGKGDVFGFHPVLNETNYPDSAEAVIESEIEFINKELFLKLCKSSSDTAFALLSAISSEFSNFIKQEQYLAHKSVRQRVAILLRELSTIFEQGDIPLSRQDLADLCGTTKESLVRVLSDFKKSDIIFSNGKTTQVIKPEELKIIQSR